MSQSQQIICPNCRSHESAVVEDTLPWWTYVHVCRNCEYTITESEWQLAPPKQLSNGSGFGLSDPRAPLGIKAKF